MAFTLTIKEEVFGSRDIHNLAVSMPSENLTLAKLIEAKVKAKVHALRADLDEKIASGYYLTATEQTLNQHSYRRKDLKMQLDAEKAVYDALAGFQKNAFFVLVNGEQKTELGEELVLTDQTEVHFIRLMPLVGG